MLKGPDAIIGENWTSRYLTRHPELVTKFSSQFDKKRIQANDPVTVQDHFKKLEQLMSQYKIAKANIYNMDEKGFLMGFASRSKVICRYQGYKQSAKIAEDANRELITVLDCISAGGRVISPFIIYKGKHQYHDWHEFTENLDCKGYQFQNLPKDGRSSQKILTAKAISLQNLPKDESRNKPIMGKALQ